MTCFTYYLPNKEFHLIFQINMSHEKFAKKISKVIYIYLFLYPRHPINRVQKLVLFFFQPQDMVLFLFLADKSAKYKILKKQITIPCIRSPCLFQSSFFVQNNVVVFKKEESTYAKYRLKVFFLFYLLHLTPSFVLPSFFCTSHQR